MPKPGDIITIEAVVGGVLYNNHLSVTVMDGDKVVQQLTIYHKTPLKSIVSPVRVGDVVELLDQKPIRGTVDYVGKNRVMVTLLTGGEVGKECSIEMGRVRHV